MRKYELEIPDNVIPKGYFPVAFRPPRDGEFWLSPLHGKLWNKVGCMCKNTSVLILTPEHPQLESE